MPPFQLIGLDRHHKEILVKHCKREKLIALMERVPSCTIYMESCGTSNYWGRIFQEMGHEPKLISPQNHIAMEQALISAAHQGENIE